MTTIYIVYGETGEYGDYRNWDVAAYYTEKEAQKHADKALKYAKAFMKKYNDGFRLTESSSPYDESFNVDLTTGTDYKVFELELHSKYICPKVEA
jgi:hypothetical protein